MILEDQDWVKGWGWMGHEDQDLQNMEEEDTQNGRWTLSTYLITNNSSVAPFPWKGHLCWRNCVGYEWNCMELKDNELDFPCQRQKNNEHEMDQNWR